jgi:hypothetical protein
VIHVKAILIGKGPGKTVTASLLADTHVVGVYDADPYGALRDLCPKAEPYTKEGLITPSLVDTSGVDKYGRPYYHILRENPDAWVVLVTSPSVHEAAATRRILEDARDLGGAQVLGLVVTMAANEAEAKATAEGFGIPLLGWVPLSTAIEDDVAKGNRPKPDKDTEARLEEIGRNLKLQRRAAAKKGKRGRWLGR